MLIIRGDNDPIVPVHLVPRTYDVSDKVTLETIAGGNHLGFFCGRWPWSSRSWLATRIPEFLGGKLT